MQALRSSQALRLAGRPALRASTLTRSTLRTRQFSTPPPTPTASKPNTSLFIGLAVAAGLGGASWLYFSSSTASKETSTAIKSGVQIAKSKISFVPTQQDYQKLYNAIANVLEEVGEQGYDDGSFGPVLLRLAWHCSGTYSTETKTGGSNYATMRFDPEALHGANNGLNIARNLLEDKIKKNPEFSWVSYGDLWTLAGVVAVQEMQGPKTPWRGGRIDGFAQNATPDGRLPDATQGSDHLRTIFYRMGFTDQEIVALSGAHALGRCHTDRSGFDGPWTFSTTTLTNDYYKLLFEEKWIWRKWGGPKQLADKKTGTLMMLPTDYTLVTDKAFKKYAKSYADDEALFFKDFSNAFSRLLELGVPESQWVAKEPWIMENLDEQKEHV